MEKSSDGNLICPHCRNEIRLNRDYKGYLMTNDLNSMRIRTPYHIIPGKEATINLDICVCSHCNTIIGLGRKM